MRAAVPKVFGDLKDSIHVVPGTNVTDILADAPYAAAVDKGSRPHWAPFEAILKWVRARGSLGLTKGGRVIKNQTREGRVKDYRAETSKSIASKLASFNVKGRRGGDGRHAPADAAEQLARAIWASIAKKGTKPQPFGLATSQYCGALLEEGVLREAVSGEKDVD